MDTFFTIIWGLIVSLTAFQCFGLLHLVMALKYKARRNNMHVLKAKRQKLGFGTYTNTRESWPSKTEVALYLVLGLWSIFYSYIVWLCFLLLNLTHNFFEIFTLLMYYSSISFILLLPTLFYPCGELWNGILVVIVSYII